MLKNQNNTSTRSSLTVPEPTSHSASRNLSIINAFRRSSILMQSTLGQFCAQPPPPQILSTNPTDRRLHSKSLPATKILVSASPNERRRSVPIVVPSEALPSNPPIRPIHHRASIVGTFVRDIRRSMFVQAIQHTNLGTHPRTSIDSYVAPSTPRESKILDATVSESAAEPVAEPELQNEEVNESSLTNTIISTLIFSAIYIPFTMAILFQSVLNFEPVHPKDWQTALSALAWKSAFILFASVFIFPFVAVYGILNRNGMDFIGFILAISSYLLIFVLLHILTVIYAYMRDDLRVIHAKNNGFRWKAANLISVLSVTFEMLQLAHPFMDVISNPNNSTSTWYGFTYITSLSVFTIPEGNTFYFRFWICFFIVIVYALWLGYGIHVNMQPDHKYASILFSFIPGTLYLSIISNLLSTMNCTSSGYDSNGNEIYVLQGGSSIQCWTTSEHKSTVMAALIALLLYSSTAMFVACYRGDASGQDSIKYKPIFLVIERTLRDVFAIATTLVTSSFASRGISLAALTLLCLTTGWLSPCSIGTLSRMKLFSQLAAIWLLLCSFISASDASAIVWFKDNIEYIVLVGWLCLLVIFVVGEVILSLYQVK